MTQLKEKFIDQPIYMAYGSNLDKSQMVFRCRDAEAIGPAYLPGWRLAFRGVADIEPSKGDKLPIGLWRISREDELKLDHYEGYPNLYRKQYFTSGDETYMVYIMNGGRLAQPHRVYYEGIRKGYADFNLPTEHLEIAVTRALREGTGYGHTPKHLKAIPR